MLSKIVSIFSLFGMLLYVSQSVNVSKQDRQQAIVDGNQSINAMVEHSVGLFVSPARQPRDASV